LRSLFHWRFRVPRECQDGASYHISGRKTSHRQGRESPRKRGGNKAQVKGSCGKGTDDAPAEIRRSKSASLIARSTGKVESGRSLSCRLWRISASPKEMIQSSGSCVLEERLNSLWLQELLCARFRAISYSDTIVPSSVQCPFGRYKALSRWAGHGRFVSR
jgi:hypothetical protein